MRTLLTALVIFGGIACAQQTTDPERSAPAAKGEVVKPVPGQVARRLEAVTLDPLQAQLSWFVSVWDLGSDMSKPADVEKYTIHINSSVMERSGELRRFQVPAADLHSLMNILSTYVMRSTVWWGHEGAAEGDAPPLLPDGSDGVKDKTKDDGREENTKPATIKKAVSSPIPPRRD
jgi:hypothetical protein